MSGRKSGVSDLRCPACGGVVSDRLDRCPHCRFTGQDTMALFSGEFSPIDPVRDAAGVWDDGERAAIRQARHRLRKQFPQIRFYVETVELGPEASLPLYGFWRINTAPLAKHETNDHRSWSVLLLIDAVTSRASVTCGYRIGHWVGDKEWRTALEAAGGAWARKGSAAAVMDFFKQASLLIQRAWKQKFMRPD